MCVTTLIVEHIPKYDSSYYSSMHWWCTLVRRAKFFFFSIRYFFHRHWQFTGQQEGAIFISIYHFLMLANFQAFVGILHMEWLRRICNRIACNQTAFPWNLPPMNYHFIDWWWNVNFCLCTRCGWFLVFISTIKYRNSVNLNSHRLSPL